METMDRDVLKLDVLRMSWWQHSFQNGLRIVGSLGVDSSDQNQWEYLMSKFEYVVYDPQWTERRD